MKTTTTHLAATDRLAGETRIPGLMKNLIATAGVCLLALPYTALANGGGYYRGGLENAGDLVGFEPANTEKIRIVDEQLTVLLGEKSANVEVIYLMRNKSKEETTVRFGFPVEESFDQFNEVDPKKSPRAESLKYCREYEVSAAGLALEVEWQAEKSKDSQFKGLAGWLISEVRFAAGEEKQIRIQFTSDYPEQGHHVSDDEYVSPARFKYRLSTAACWAGTIGKGVITLKADGISVDDLRVIKPVNRFKREGDAWVWRFEDLEPSMADDFEVEAVPEVYTHWTAVDPSKPQKGFEQYQRRGTTWSMTHSNYQVKASSTLEPQYAPENLKKMNNGSDRHFWAEGASGSGIGEWLELTPEVAKPLIAISLKPGCWKSDELFAANARPKKVRVELNGEHSQTIELPDAMEVYTMPVLNYDKPVKTIRLTFDDVWPGKRFEDLCVTQVTLQARLDKEPEIQPAR